MRFMMIVHPSREEDDDEARRLRRLREMMRYREELRQAGVLLDAEALQPAERGLRIAYPHPGEEPVVTEGLSDEAVASIAAFTLIETPSREEAIAWARRMPDPGGVEGGAIELRQVLEASEVSQDAATRAKLERFRV